MDRLRTAILVALLMLLASDALPQAAPVRVRSVRELEQAVKRLGPGSVVELADGAYETTAPIVLTGISGSRSAPVVIRPVTQNGATLTGKAGFTLTDCEHVVIDGLVFAHESQRSAVLLTDCRNIRITENLFRLREGASERDEYWVYVRGRRSGNNRIDHNIFENKRNRGNMLFVRGDDASLTCSQNDRVDHNYFRNVVYSRGANGHETVRFGSDTLGWADRGSFTVFEDNLLEDCSGEGEIISVKSSDNTIRRNTFINCYGSIQLRECNRCTVSGNFMLCTDGGDNRGGVKIYGVGHRVYNNYFQGLTGRYQEAPLAVMAGNFKGLKATGDGKQFGGVIAGRAEGAVVVHNTWVDCSTLLFGGKGDPKRPLAPAGCVFMSNLIVNTGGDRPLASLDSGENMRFAANLAFTSGRGGLSGLPAGANAFLSRDPRLRRERGLWRLSSGSPAIDRAAPLNQPIKTDIFGRSRGSTPDIGAEEYSSRPVNFRPLTPADVGPHSPGLRKE